MPIHIMYQALKGISEVQPTGSYCNLVLNKRSGEIAGVWHRVIQGNNLVDIGLDMST